MKTDKDSLKELENAVNSTVKKMYDSLDKEFNEAINDLRESTKELDRMANEFENDVNEYLIKNNTTPDFFKPELIYSGVLGKYINVKTGEVVENE